MNITRAADAPPWRSPFVMGNGLLSTAWQQWIGTITGRVSKIGYGSTDSPTPFTVNGGQTYAMPVVATGTAPGEFAQAAFAPLPAGVTLSATVTAQDEVTVLFTNRTGAAVVVPAGSLSIRVEKP